MFCLPSTLSSRPPVCLSELDGARLHLYTPRASSPTEAGRWVPEWLGLLCPEATPASFETRLITVHQAIDDAAACLTRRSLALTCLDSSTRTLPPPHAGPDGPRGRATRGEGRGGARLGRPCLTVLALAPCWMLRPSKLGSTGVAMLMTRVVRGATQGKGLPSIADASLLPGLARARSRPRQLSPPALAPLFGSVPPAFKQPSNRRSRDAPCPARRPSRLPFNTRLFRPIRPERGQTADQQIPRPTRAEPTRSSPEPLSRARGPKVPWHRAGMTLPRRRSTAVSDTRTPRESAGEEKGHLSQLGGPQHGRPPPSMLHMCWLLMLVCLGGFLLVGPPPRQDASCFLLLPLLLPTSLDSSI